MSLVEGFTEEEEEVYDRIEAIGIRQPVPKARSVILMPGGAWRRLNSARLTSLAIFSTV